MPKSATLKAKALRRENYVDRFKSQKESVAVPPSLKSTSNRTRVEEQLQELKERQGRWTKPSQAHSRGFQKTFNPPPIVFRQSILTDDQVHIPTEAEKESEKYGWKSLLAGEAGEDLNQYNSELPDSDVRTEVSSTQLTLPTNIYELLDDEDAKPKLPIFKASIL